MAIFLRLPGHKRAALREKRVRSSARHRYPARCAYMKDKHVECPANMGASFRAGFKWTDGGWKRVYFVGGE